MGVYRRIFYRIAMALYPLLKRCFNPFLLRHPRLHRFVREVREPVKAFLRSPVYAMDVSSGDGEAIPSWLVEEWRDIHQLDPKLFPDQALLESVTFYLYTMPVSEIGRCYSELCALYGSNKSHVFLVPWLLRGGADLVALNYINALAQQALAGDIVVIATVDACSPWSEKLPASVRFIPFGSSYSHLSHDEQEKLLVRLLLQKAPKVIHNINSDLGYRLFVKYGKALSSISNLYASSFCIDLGPEGNMTGYPVWYLPACFDVLKSIFSDNRKHLELLHTLYALSKEKMQIHYQPMQSVNATRKKTVRATSGRLEILWAGRLDRQKRPDLLIELARKSVHLPFHFHVYGSPVMDMKKYNYSFSRNRNITYHGHFDGLFSIPARDYDVFLYTSQWDGLPNILLEAISLGYPVIASNVGGVSELIIDGDTGFLVEPYDDTDRFVHCLRRIFDDRSISDTMVKNAQALVSERHSWEAFQESLTKIPGYIDEQINVKRTTYDL